MARLLLPLWLAACGTSPMRSDDRDGDGYPTPQDCDDGDPTIHPTAADTPYDGIDSNCLGDDDFDVDYDGYPVDVDCDDRDNAVHPGADELCDGADQDCDEAVDEEAIDGVPVYPDADGDGYGAADAPAEIGCASVDGWSDAATDCDDAQPARFPGNPEVCDGLDNDCDDAVDDEVFDYTSWPDADEDGFGDESAEPAQTCFAPPDGYVLNPFDCDDAHPDTYDGAPDVACDHRDNDCDPLTTEAGAALVDGVLAAGLADALATAPAGATVELCEGTYDGALSIPRGLSLVGAGSELTVIDGLGLGPALAVDTSEPVTMSGLTLTNGVGRDDGAGVHEGGGLWVEADGDVVATDLKVVFNRGGSGAGVRLGDRARFELTGGEISDNTGDALLTWGFSVGGGLYVYPDSTVILADVTIERNTASLCGGVELLSGGTTLTGGGSTEIRDNEATEFHGGGVCADAGAALADLKIVDNTALFSGGGIHAAAPLELTGVWVEGNDGGLTGGGISLEASGLTDPSRFVGCVIIDNAALLGGGGLHTDAAVLIEDGEVSNNSESFYSSTGGGAELVGTSTLTSVNTTWVANVDHDVGMGTDSFVAGLLEDFICDASTGACL